MNPKGYTDSHAHLSKFPLDENLHQMILRAKNAGVETIVNICTDIETLQRGLELSKHFPWIHNSASTTPHDVDQEGADVFPIIAKHAKQGDLVAIGETGLDYHYTHSGRENQQNFLRQYLRLALDCSLPVVIHCREAFEDFFEILDQEYCVNGEHLPGVLHCFTGTLSEAEQVIKRGWYLSLSGIVTFKKSEALREVAKYVPLDQLLIETDTPYLAPQSKRGKSNEPSFLPETAEIIAKVKGISLETVIEATTINAKMLFKY